MAEYSKGEWEVIHKFDDNWWIGNGEVPICSLEGENIQANAHLIAAAPLMYEALNCVLRSWALWGKVTQPDIIMARKALAKAEGK